MPFCCIGGICAFEGKTGRCISCFGTRDEIRGRKEMTGARRVPSPRSVAEIPVHTALGIWT
ncbi:DUF1289 domain-containing protein [Burkholderia pseudomallei]|nr:DUF1289 domain-containing protein [Burkholderia pseudomallei]MEB5488960.1 DUF1289 domain-containing protein [Burkholderia pseudomallei]MEB5497324.1 DUF1289 domain-containing protein [Burkholderia pseudomallei]MEB5502563.1 DUF1289 domain-containing protein [Burkholderia pseudomallei]MEB5508201.1 DUF1289 domain-containing protein [Burkholderia pseudomallei]